MKTSCRIHYCFSWFERDIYIECLERKGSMSNFVEIKFFELYEMFSTYSFNVAKKEQQLHTFSRKIRVQFCSSMDLPELAELCFRFLVKFAILDVELCSKDAIFNS